MRIRIVVVAVFAACMLSRVAAAQGPFDARSLHLFVQDSDGRPIADADALLGGMFVDRSDYNGVITIRSTPAMILPAILEVSAHGYQPHRMILEGQRQDGTVVRLERLSGGAPKSGGSVSASELQPQVRAESQRLHQAALGALQARDYGAAERLLLGALSLAPSSVAIHNNLGVVALRRGEIDRSGEWFEKAHRIDSRDPFAAGNLGIVRWAQRRHEESRTLLEQAVAAGFAADTGRYLLGLLALESGRWKEAEQRLATVPADRFRHRDLFRAAALARLGRAREAAKRLAEYREQNPVPMLGSPWRAPD